MAKRKRQGKEMSALRFAVVAQRVACSLCGARVGRRCRNLGRKELRIVHRVRVKAYKAWLVEEQELELLRGRDEARRAARAKASAPRQTILRKKAR